ncbi:MAG TPA: RagB/SusD family nutrient uptake outer membrane protein [Bacteroidales bacterium]|nr:RagB/SusD family nutrient uptake outer membrane protein [Bacteroidales bacterium]
MKKITYFIAITALLFFATSCKDVLDQQAVDAFNQDVVFADINIVKAYVGKCYDRMGGNTDAGVLGMREDLLSSATDQTLCIHRPANYVDLKGDMRPDNLGFYNNNGYGGYLRWTNLYANIQNLNTIIAGIDDVNVTTPDAEKLRDRLKGEALFIRAYEYATLLFVHGGVVLIDQPFKLDDDFSTQVRSSIENTKNFIVKDIDAAIPLLTGQTIEQGRATPAACAALKSRLLLFCGSKLTNGGFSASNPLVSFPSGQQTALLQAARDAAKAVMDGTYGAFSLVGSTSDPAQPLTQTQITSYAENYQKLFTQKGTWNKETIWGIQYPITGGNYNTCNRWNGPCGYHNWGNNNPTEPAVRSFEMADGTEFNWNQYHPGDQFTARTATAAELAANPLLNPYNGREPRFYAIVLYHGAPWQARGDLPPYVETGHFYNNDGTVRLNGTDTRQGLIEAWNGTKTGYYLKKFMDPETNGQYNNNTNTWVEFRYAEILLNYAEACIELAVLGQNADLQNGLDALNLVRNRAGLPDRVTNDPLIARDYIRHERAIEFFGEGHRWYDTRRWMIRDQVTTNVYGMKIKQYDNGNMEWKLDQNDLEDARTWAGDFYYWLPISRDERIKAPQVEQNPGY